MVVPAVGEGAHAILELDGGTSGSIRSPGIQIGENPMADSHLPMLFYLAPTVLTASGIISVVFGGSPRRRLHAGLGTLHPQLIAMGCVAIVLVNLLLLPDVFARVLENLLDGEWTVGTTFLNTTAIPELSQL